MKVKSVLRLLPVVLLLTGCSTTKEAHSDLPYKKLGENEEITEEKFFEIAYSLKNNYLDYSKCICTGKVEIVESTGGESKKYLNQLLSQKIDDSDFKFYELGSSATVEAYRPDRMIAGRNTSHHKCYLLDNKLAFSHNGEFEIDIDHYKFLSYCYFNEDGLMIREEMVYDINFYDDTSLFIYDTISYEWIK